VLHLGVPARKHCLVSPEARDTGAGFAKRQYETFLDAGLYLGWNKGL